MKASQWYFPVVLLITLYKVQRKTLEEPFFGIVSFLSCFLLRHQLCEVKGFCAETLKLSGDGDNGAVPHNPGGGTPIYNLYRYVPL